MSESSGVLMLRLRSFGARGYDSAAHHSPASPVTSPEMLTRRPSPLGLLISSDGSGDGEREGVYAWASYAAVKPTPLSFFETCERRRFGAKTLKLERRFLKVFVDLMLGVCELDSCAWRLSALSVGVRVFRRPRNDMGRADQRRKREEREKELTASDRES